MTFQKGFNKGELHPDWVPEGTIVTRGNGERFIKCSSHPKGPWISEYRLIIEKKLGRFLRQDEHVHHVNGDHNDNAPDNLCLLNRRSHMIIHKGISKKECINGKISEHITSTEDTVDTPYESCGDFSPNNPKYHTPQQFIKTVIQEYNDSSWEIASGDIEIGFEEYARIRIKLNNFLHKLFIIKVLSA